MDAEGDRAEPQVTDSGNIVNNNTNVNPPPPNQIATPVFLGLIVLVLLVLVMSILDRRSLSSQIEFAASVAAEAKGIANQAERQAQNAEREARLSMDKEEIDASNIAVNKALIESYVVAKQVVQQEKNK